MSAARSSRCGLGRRPARRVRGSGRRAVSPAGPAGRWGGCLIGAVACAVAWALSACAPAPTVSSTEALAASRERTAALAFERGDLDAARRDYRHALALHDALGDLPARAGVVLSLARVAAQAGRLDEARALVDQVLADASTLPVQTRARAHGRAAALELARAEPGLATLHLDQAERLCAPACADAGALTVLRARVALQQQQAPLAIALANAALALPALAAGDRPAGQAGAERANALRVRGLAELSLGRAAEAVVSASAALELDQVLGLVERVGADLHLLSSAHQHLGNADLARHYQRMAERARQAREMMRSQGPPP